MCRMHLSPVSVTLYLSLPVCLLPVCHLYLSPLPLTCFHLLYPSLFFCHSISVTCICHSLPVAYICYLSVTCICHLYLLPLSITLYLSRLNCHSISVACICHSLSVTWICHLYVSPASVTCILHALSLTFICHLYQAHSVIHSSFVHFEFRVFRNQLFLDRCDLTVVISYLMVNRQCADVLVAVILLLPDRTFTH